MSDESIRQALAESFEDQRLSRKERKSLRKLIEDEEDEAHVRRLAFAFATERMTTAPAEGPQLLTWLEDVSRAVTHRATHRASAQAAKVEAFFSPGNGCRDRIARAIREARRSIDLCVFTITDDHLVEAIMAADARGVKVRIAADNDKAEDRGSDVHRLQRAGLAVRVDRSPHHMHHKFALFDREMLLNGSYNWTRSAFQKNRENVVVTRHPVLVSRFATAFDEMWETFVE